LFDILFFGYNDKRKKNPQNRAHLGHQASILTSTPIKEHVKKSHLILKSVQA